jgi:hypothetical protein
MRELHGLDPHALGDDVLGATEPLILRGLLAGWPAVQAGLASEQGADQGADQGIDQGVDNYLRRFYRDATVGAFLGAPDIDGRFFYNADLSGFNFGSVRARLDAILDEIAAHRHDALPPSVYVGSTTIDTCLPGFTAENIINLGPREALASIWIGNRTRIAAHYDLPDNLACVVAGHRRFTLFAPDQLQNLYIGPLDFTPAGQAISLVDFKRPDLVRFPRFAQAMEQAHVAELGPGDAIFIPSMWWHHVEALDSFNVLVNYWWRQSPDYMDTPTNTLMLALMTIRDLPPEQRAAWQEIFRHYVFEADAHTSSHIGEQARRALAPLDENAARILRAQLIKKLNR